MIKTLVFDFDGVIMDSNQLKRAAWYDVFPEHLVSARLVSDVVERNKGNRYDILHEIFTVLKRPQETVHLLVDGYARRFNEAVQTRLTSEGVSADTLHALTELAERYPLYINSATPIQGLVETVENLHIGYLFKAVFGVPPSKEENLQIIAVREGISPDEIAFVGDGEGDWQAARSTGVYFIGFANKDNNWSEREFPLISGLDQIGGLITTV